MTDKELVLDSIRVFANSHECEYIAHDSEQFEHEKDLKYIEKKIEEWHRKAQAFDEVLKYEPQLLDADDAIDYGNSISKIVREYESEDE